MTTGNIREKLIALFDDINKFYKDFASAITIADFENTCSQNFPIEDFFKQLFEEREFNVYVTREYLDKTLSDYDLSINVLNEFRTEFQKNQAREAELKRIKVQKQIERGRVEAQKRRRKNIYILSILGIALIITSFLVYHYRNEEKLKANLIAEQREIIIQSQKEIVEKYFNSYQEGDIDLLLNFWAEKPVRYGFITEVSNKEEITSAILVFLKLNRSVINEILDIQYLQDNSYDVRILQKVINRELDIESHTEKVVNIVLDEENRIIQEFSRGSERIIFISRVLRGYLEGRYVGGILNDQRSGYGEMTYKNGDVYKGNWLKDERRGYGEMTYKNGDIFKGEWNGFNKGKGEMIIASSKALATHSNLESNTIMNRTNEKELNGFSNWANDHPKNEEEYAYFFGNDGKWYTNGNLLKHSYGLYEIDFPINVLKGYAYVGTFGGHSYFRSIGITYLASSPFDTKTNKINSKVIGAWTVAKSKSPQAGYLVEINTAEEQDYLRNKLEGTNKAYWIGMKNINGNFTWLSQK